MSPLPQLAHNWIMRGDLQIAAMLCDWAEAAGDPPASTLYARGAILQRSHQWVAARQYMEEAIAAVPDAARPYLGRGISQINLGDFDGAIASLHASILRDLNNPMAWHELSCAHMLSGSYVEALAAAERAVCMDRSIPVCHIQLGDMSNLFGEDEAAIVEYRRARELNGGDYPEAECAEAAMLLRLGRWAEGWPRFEARWRIQRRVATWDYRGAPLYTGTLEGMRGRRVLLRCEQGYGDTIHFARYIPLVAVMADVIFEVAPPFKRLAERMVTRWPVVLFERNQPAPDFDVQTSLMSLPLLFGTIPETCPPPTQFTIPLHTQPPGCPLRIGLCWAGGPRAEDPMANSIDRRRSLPGSAFDPLREIAKQHGISVRSLQLEDIESEAGGDTADWLTTAEIIAGLDLVITVDTAVAHLAASLGVPTWLCARWSGCWRWGNHGNDTPWYPSMRLYRQPRLGDWQPVLQQVAHDLQEWADD